MTREIVKDYKGLVKVDKSFVVNEDDEAYNIAMARRAKMRKEHELENRVTGLEQKLDLILDLLKQKA
jgi:hypothetical protein